MTINRTIEYITVNKSPFLHDDIYFVIMFILLGIVCQAIALSGIIGNGINCVVFIKQGFSDPINISLLTLAIADLCSLLSISWSNLCFTPSFRDSGIPMATYEVHLITGSWLHVMITRITGWITAFISLERCVCVTAPLKVRIWFTHSRHTTTMLAIYTVTMACASLAYLTTGLGWRFFPERNRTLIGLVYLMDPYKTKITIIVSYAVNGVFMPVSCFLSVTAFTAILVVKLNHKAAWRYSHASVAHQTHHDSTVHCKINAKKIKVAKMVVLISIIFITCFIPAVTIFIAGYVERQLNYDGLYKNMFIVIMSVSAVTEAINSSINIFVYLIMSTKYRHTFLCVLKVKMLIK